MSTPIDMLNQLLEDIGNYSDTMYELGHDSIANDLLSIAQGHDPLEISTEPEEKRPSPNQPHAFDYRNLEDRKTCGYLGCGTSPTNPIHHV